MKNAVFPDLQSKDFYTCGRGAINKNDLLRRNPKVVTIEKITIYRDD